MQQYIQPCLFFVLQQLSVLARVLIQNTRFIRRTLGEYLITTFQRGKPREISPDTYKVFNEAVGQVG